MAVMVTFTLRADSKTYQGMHGQLLPVAKSAGLLFHSAHESGSEVGIVDFWPSSEAWNSFLEGPVTEGLKAAGIAQPDDLEVTPVLNADSG